MLVITTHSGSRLYTEGCHMIAFFQLTLFSSAVLPLLLHISTWRLLCVSTASTPRFKCRHAASECCASGCIPAVLPPAPRYCTASWANGLPSSWHADKAQAYSLTQAQGSTLGVTVDDTNLHVAQKVQLSTTCMLWGQHCPPPWLSQHAGDLTERIP